MDQCHGQVQAATHPNTEGTCPSIYLLSQSDQLDQLLRTLFGVCTSGSEKLALQCEKLQWLHDHPQDRAAMGIAARKRALELPWERFGASVVSAHEAALAQLRAKGREEP